VAPDGSGNIAVSSAKGEQEALAIDPDNTALTGRCHCGAVEVELRLGNPVSQIRVRACQCEFCRRHGAATASDPGGMATIRSRSCLVHYRFGARTTDFLICSVCGVYVAAAMDDEGRLLATLNVAGLRMSPLHEMTPEPADYDREDPISRRARRLSLWTPTVLEINGRHGNLKHAKNRS
jgi:hypothetical protein